MILTNQRALITHGDVFHTINANTQSKIDISFTNQPVPISNFKADIELIKTRNFPLLRSVMRALESGEIIPCYNGNQSSSLVFLYGRDKNTIQKVYINMNRYMKKEQGVDPNTGNITERFSIIGGYEVLYELLLAAYVGLKSEKALMSPTVLSLVSEVYVDMFAQLISRNFGNPVDGEKFRFLTKYFFFDGQVNGVTLAQTSNYGVDKFNTLKIKYPDFFSLKQITLEEYIELLRLEFPSLARNNLSLKAFIINSVAGLGDSGVYLLDNFAYLMSIICSKCRRSKVFQGYMLKSIESDASRTLTAIYQAIS